MAQKTKPATVPLPPSYHRPCPPNRNQSDPIADALQALLPAYGLSSSARLRRLTASENITYCACDPLGDQRIVLRVHRVGYHSDDEIESERAWIDALVQEDVVPTAVPINLANGQALGQINIEGIQRTVSAFAFLEGEEPLVGEHLAARFHTLGKLTARLHDHACAWTLPKQFQRKVWDFDTMFGAQPLWGDWREAISGISDQTSVASALARCAQQVARYGKGRNVFGLIHADLRLANLLDDGARLAVIDFDDCGFGWFAYDFAAAISFHEDDPSIPSLQEAWLHGYRTVRAFSDTDEAMLPAMIFMRRLILTAWLATRADSDTAAQFGDGFAHGTVRLAEQFLSQTS